MSGRGRSRERGGDRERGRDRERGDRRPREVSRSRSGSRSRDRDRNYSRRSKYSRSRSRSPPRRRRSRSRSRSPGRGRRASPPRGYNYTAPPPPMPPRAAPPMPPRAAPPRQAGAGWAERETHYDAQANDPQQSRAAALAKRKGGALYKYKLFANAVKRRMYGAYARGAPAIVELGCGRGGDISKWRDARVRRVIALDLSTAQLDEARRREGQGGGRGGGGKGGGGGTQIEWRHASMLQPDLAASLRPRLPDDGAAAVVSQFAVHYAFESEASASALLAQVAALLRPGGVFFGAAPDGDAILRAIATDGDGRTLQRDGLLLRLEGAGDDAAAAGASEFGRLLLFSLQDTVTAGSEHDDCTEFLLHRAALVRLAAAHGLVPVELESMAASAAEPASAATSLDAAQRYVAALYFTFAFRLERAASAPDAAEPAPADAST